MTSKSNNKLDNIAQLPTGKLANVEKRARSKWYTQQIIKPLLNYNSPLYKSYYRANHCGDFIRQEGKKITSRYCNSRICHVCNRIRTAKMMGGYIEPLIQLGELHFTTLTRRNVTAEELPGTIKKMLQDMANIIRVLREKRGIDISGIRKIEITYNAKQKNYHPHFHILHNKDVGDIIIDEWLKRNVGVANKSGWDFFEKKMVDIQKTEPVRKKGENDKKFLNELFKYASKFVMKDNKERGIFYIHAYALDVILRSLHRKRTMQTFGEIRKVKIVEDITEVGELVSQVVEDIEDIGEKVKMWKWGGYKILKAHEPNWIDTKGNNLTNYKPPNITFVNVPGESLPYTPEERKKAKFVDELV